MRHDTEINDEHLKHIKQICDEDAAGLLKAHESYGNSWQKRGGAGAYLIMIRKFDRLEQTLPKFGFDIFRAIAEDPRAEGVIDDVRDARRYLCLIEAEMRARGAIAANSVHRDNTDNHDYHEGCLCPACKGETMRRERERHPTKKLSGSAAFAPHNKGERTNSE